MGSATQEGDIAPNAGTYPTSTTDVYCVSCHTDHNYFNARQGRQPALRHRQRERSATSNSDYSSTSPYGICVSCHATAKAKQGMGTDQLNVGGANTPVIDGAQFNTSAHNYNVASTFGTSTFNANCSKCHSDEQTKSYRGSTYKFGTHYSCGVRHPRGARRLACRRLRRGRRVLRVPLHAAGGLKAVADIDWYNQSSMDATSQSIRGLMAGTPATAQTQTNTLYFRADRRDDPAEPMPNAHQTADTFTAGTWIGGRWRPTFPTTAYETKTRAQGTSTSATADGDLHLAAVASRPTVRPRPLTRSTSTPGVHRLTTPYVRYRIYKWNANDTIGTYICPGHTYATEMG